MVDFSCYSVRLPKLKTKITEFSYLLEKCCHNSHCRKHYSAQKVNHEGSVKGVTKKCLVLSLCLKPNAVFCSDPALGFLPSSQVSYGQQFMKGYSFSQDIYLYIWSDTIIVNSVLILFRFSIPVRFCLYVPYISKRK